MACRPMVRRKRHLHQNAQNAQNASNADAKQSSDKKSDDEVTDVDFEEVK